MPAALKRIRGKWRVIEQDTGDILKNAAGTPVDGGGHTSEKGALAQVGAINTPKAKRHRI